LFLCAVPEQRPRTIMALPKCRHSVVVVVGRSCGLKQPVSRAGITEVGGRNLAPYMFFCLAMSILAGAAVPLARWLAVRGVAAGCR